jgi:hypothetical protein
MARPILGQMAAPVSPLVAEAVAAAVLAGASPKVAAAITRAAIRAVMEIAAPVDMEVCPEVEARIEAIKPVVAERVLAATEGRLAVLTGAQRLRRNIAEHAGFGEGASFMREPEAVHRRRQRGRRRARPTSTSSGEQKLPQRLAAEEEADSTATTAGSNSSGEVTEPEEFQKQDEPSFTLELLVSVLKGAQRFVNKLGDRADNEVVTRVADFVDAASELIQILADKG